jgi:glycine C-acetyltransferase
MDPLKFSLADFFFNDNPDVLSPPQDYVEWVNDPRVKACFSFYEQSLLSAPNARTEILSKLDQQRRKVINLTSYNYLGLATHPEVLQAAKDTMDKYGMSASGAALLSGTFDLHTKLAAQLADFKQKEACMLFSGGLAGNLGAIQGMLRKGDYMVMDEKVHQSLIDGGTLAGAKMLFFKHNDIESLSAMLEKCKGRRVLVAVEGVYSMDGDLARLPEIVDVCESFKVPIYLDEAHSTLMFGEKGRGVAEHFGLEDKIGVSFGTLSKSFGGVGGFVCANASLIQYIKVYNSAFSFSCSPSPPIVGGVLKALEIATRDTSLKDKLWENIHYFRNKLLDLKLNLGDSASQIIPIIIGSSGEQLYRMAAEVQQRGLFLQPVDFPAVPAHLRRFRVSVSSLLSKDDIDEACNIIEDVIARKLN